jgi:hypothetical protein
MIALSYVFRFTVTRAWTSERIFSNGLPGYTLSEPASLLLLGAGLFSFSLYLEES